MNKKNYVCIACPNSCKLTVWEEGGEIIVEGYTCKRGIDHGKNEYTNPMRMLTTTVAIEGSHHRRLSVVSSDEIPKDMIDKCLEELYALKLEAPIKRGEVIAANICGTGVDIVASRTMKRAQTAWLKEEYV